MKQYHDLLRDILESAQEKEDRTGTGTIAVFGRTMRFDLRDGTVPIVTTKKVHFKSVLHELLWFLMGTDDTSYLEQNNVTIWREWQTELKRADGTVYPSIGPLYGVNWVRYKTHEGLEINQLQSVIDEIKVRPHSRRLLVSAWNPATLPDPSLSPQENVLLGKGALAPCHTLFQFVVNDGRLSSLLFQRSADSFLGLPYNILSYSILTRMVAEQTGLLPGEFVWMGGDVHIYKNHIEQVKTQLAREPRPLPKMMIKRKPNSIFDYRYEDFELIGYDPHPAIKADVSI